MSLKQKTISGLLWSFIDQFANQSINFVIGIILARMLSPREFGLIGMITVFIAISDSFINSGFSSALIRKKNCTEVDYSTVFYFNLVVGIFFFFLLFLLAPKIGEFFNETEIIPIIQVLGIILIINSFTLIQSTILTKRLDFRLQTRISVMASVGSGVISLVMAYSGFGVWSLVARQLSRQALNSILLWIQNKWKPILVFSKKSFFELFGFGSKLLLSGLLDTLYRNIYYLVIGKYFSAQELGFFTRANNFRDLPSQNLNRVISRVTFPVLSSIQNDIPRLKTSYQKLIRSTMFITFILMLGMAAVADSMILTLIGEKWEPSVVYLQMLCIVGMFYPLHALNLNMLQVQGRSDLVLKLEIIKKALAIPTIFIGIIWGIKIMIAGMMINTIISYFLNSYWSGQMIGYSFTQQIRDILPSFILAFVMAALVFVAGLVIPIEPIWMFITQIILGAVLIFSVSELLKINDYLFIKRLLLEKIVTIKNKQNGHFK